jgi:hypothetical protein
MASTAPAKSAGEAPSSPTKVKHTTTNATPTHPFIDTTISSINTNPVELDSTPVSPVARKESWHVKGQAAAATVSPDMEEEVYGELSGEKGGNGVSREVRTRPGKYVELDCLKLIDSLGRSVNNSSQTVVKTLPSWWTFRRHHEQKSMRWQP